MAQIYKAYIVAGFDYQQQKGASSLVILHDGDEYFHRTVLYGEDAKKIRQPTTAKLIYLAIAEIAARVPEGSIVTIYTTYLRVVRIVSGQYTPSWKSRDYIDLIRETAGKRGTVVKVSTEEGIYENPIYSRLRHDVESATDIPLFEGGYVYDVLDRRQERAALPKAEKPRRKRKHYRYKIPLDLD